jgi:uroporphyrinogen-III synthase
VNQPPRRVLVTRSEPGASETAGRLRAAGFDAVVEPLFEIAPIDVAIPEFDALAFTSANGVRRMARLSPRRNVPVWCVGQRTAQAARDLGFTDVTSADADVHALADLIGAQLKTGMRLLHVGNEESRGDLAGQLSAVGHKAAFVAVFRARPAAAPATRLAGHLQGRERFDAILIHSPRAGAILAGFATDAPDRSPLRVVAISQAAAGPLKDLAAQVEIAVTPDEPAMISALSRLVFS